jgi:hypothetical protein
MGWMVTWQVTCEVCGKQGPSDRNSVAAERKAREAGWVRGQMLGIALHLCPEHAHDERPEWWPNSTGTRFCWEDE